MVGLSVLLMLFNGLLNNIIIPLQSRLAVIYDQSNKIVNIATILSFLFFSLMNVPANHILDLRGLRFGFLVGLSFYLVGILMACFVNVAFPMLIAGYLFFTIGQPFILNTPAKIATYWFFPKNVIENLFRELWQLLLWWGPISSDLDWALPFPLSQ
jgi:MFS family permease